MAVSYTHLDVYKRQIQYTGRSETEYYDNIDRALADSWRVENAINGFRWLAYNFVTCTVTVAENFGQFELGPQSPVRRFWLRVKNRLPALGHSLDLLEWRDALPGAHIVSTMLKQGYDALPPARKALEVSPTPGNDRSIVLESLSRLHELLYADSKLPELSLIHI